MGKAGKILKYTVIGLIAVFFPPLLFIFIGWKFFKMFLMFYFKTLYLLIRFPIWLFIQLPLHYIGVSIHKTSEAFSKAYGLIMVHKKRYGLLFGILFIMMLYMFLPRNMDAAMSFLTDATLIVPFLVLIPFIITFTIALISSHFRMPDIARKKMPGGLDTGMKRRAAQSATTAKRGAAQSATAAATVGHAGLKAYNSVEGDNLNEKMENAQKAANVAKSGASKAKNIAGEAAQGEGLAAAEGETILAGDMVATLEGMPLIGGMLTGAGEAAGVAGAVGGSVTASGGTILLALLLALLLAFLGFIVISIILSVLIFWVAGIVIPMIIGPLVGPIMGALGLGQAYGQWFSQSFANEFAPQISFEEEARVVEQATAKVGCFMQGPACIRQWRQNHTQRPGSEDVGEKYRLEPSITAAEQGIDVAYKQKNYKIPVRFKLENTRHGLKGIPARDVRYKVSIVDSSHQGDKAYCSTGWKDVENTPFGEPSTILPGSSYTPTLDKLNLTIGECGMLQPALGHTFTARLDVQYEYSSQSTLYIDAMSRQHMRDEGIEREPKQSETADTPVETFVNARSPVGFYETEDGYESRFTLRVGTETERNDVEYFTHRKEFKVIDSSKTVDAADSGCRGLEHENRNKYRLSDRAQDRINDRINKNDISTWFDSAKSPAPIRCTFELEDPRSISETGETLTFRADANYTVNIEQMSNTFTVQNTHCTSRANCPILFHLTSSELSEVLSSGSLPPEQWENEDEDPRLTDAYKAWDKAYCDGVDAGNGCSATDDYQSSYEDEEIEGGVEDGELALKWPEVKDTKKIFSCSLKESPDKGIGNTASISPEKLQEVNGKDWKRLNYTGGSEWEVVEYKKTMTLSEAIDKGYYKDSSDLVKFFTGIADSSAVPLDTQGTFIAKSCKNGKPDYTLIGTSVSLHG